MSETFDKSDVRRINFIIGQCLDRESDDEEQELVPGTEEKVCILYNKNILSDEEAREIVLNASYSYDPRVVYMTQVQADFLAGRNPYENLPEREEDEDK